MVLKGATATARNSCIDAMKGVGVVMMVAGHCGAPFTDFVYLFHMALFFCISGYLWNDSNASSAKALLLYGKRKVLSLYLPFVAVSIFFIIMHNLFLASGVYTDDIRFLEMMPSKHDVLNSAYSVREMAVKVLRAFLFFNSEQLTGALWFVRTLFVISIGHAVSRYIALHCIASMVVNTRELWLLCWSSSCF